MDALYQTLSRISISSVLWVTWKTKKKLYHLFLID
jgi:hypothetical protein